MMKFSTLKVFLIVLLCFNFVCSQDCGTPVECYTKAINRLEQARSEYRISEQNLNKQIDELKSKLNEQVEKNVELNKQVGSLKRQDIVDEVGSDLTDTNKEKFNKLAEEVWSAQ